MTSVFIISYGFFTHTSTGVLPIGNARYEVDLAGGWDRDLELNVGTGTRKLHVRLSTQAN